MEWELVGYPVERDGGDEERRDSDDDGAKQRRSAEDWQTCH